MSRARFDLACALVREAGAMAAEGQTAMVARPDAVRSKGHQDFLTEMDLAVEAFLRRRILAVFPEDGFIGEEGGGRRAQYTWVVDPIDGTANYMRGLRHWAVSVACVRDDEPHFGVVHDGAHDCLYHALAGGEAFCEDRRIKASPLAEPARALALLGSSERTRFETYLAAVAAIHEAGMDYRRLGAAAVGILRVAAGQANLFLEENLNSWDALAAMIIARAAGCVTTPMDRAFTHGGGTVLVTTPALAGRIVPPLAEVVEGLGPLAAPPQAP